MIRVWLLCLLSALWPVLGTAQEWRKPARAPVLLVRVVAAGKDAGPAATSELSDILPLLRENLRFQSYRLLCSRRVVLREGNKVDLTGGLRMVFSEVRGVDFRVRVEKGKGRLIETRLRLRPGKPVILGGLPADGAGTLLLVLQLPKPAL